ncbi:MAG TPA: ABC transporter substrate-binding protein [Candidatus Binatia bacterium]|nr:ABC transporter substrate-binding protein [Candidatus Binatia bacterium]
MKLIRAGLIITLTIGVATSLPAAEAQQSRKMFRVGVLSPSADSFLNAFKQGLRELNYIEGRNIFLEYRSAEGRVDRLFELAAELARLKLDVIVTITSPGVRAAKQATSTIPIVMGGVDDAVEQGFVASLAKPGGNVTGTSWLNPELSGKRLELLKETFPKVSRVAVLREAIGGASSLRATIDAARVLGVQLQILELRDPNELNSAFAAIAHERAGALDVLPGLMITAYMRQIVDLAGNARLPVIFPDGQFVESGGLMSYGPNVSDLYRRAATYVDKILKGAKPSELPIEQPTRFELVINLKTAKQIGVTIPQPVLYRADKVIK